MTNPTLVLASASPRRAALLRQIGVAALIDPADIDETIAPGTRPAAAALALATQKADVVAARQRAGVVVLAADTVVVIDDSILGKPSDRDDAAAMLTQLSGRTHEVHTGVCVVHTGDGRRAGATATTSVTMRAISPDEISAYVATGEPDDVAGAYAIQGRAAIFVERIDGDHTNVVGLPLALVAEQLTLVGISVATGWAST